MLHAVQIHGKELQLLPSIFSYESSKFSSPAFAVMFQGGVAMALILFGLDFEYLVEMATLINCITLAAEFTGFLRLRYCEPDTARPYLVPGGLPVAWGITIVKCCVVLVIFFCAAFQMRLVGAVLVINSCFLLYLVGNYHMQNPSNPQEHTNTHHAITEDAASVELEEHEPREDEDNIINKTQHPLIAADETEALGGGAHSKM